MSFILCLMFCRANGLSSKVTAYQQCCLIVANLKLPRITAVRGILTWIHRELRAVLAEIEETTSRDKKSDFSKARNFAS